jgi:hypothetical protein
MMNKEGLITDTIVDVICEKHINSDCGPDLSFKRGFFAQGEYLPGRSVLSDQKVLITEEYIIRMVKNGAGRIRVPQNSIITPSAKLLIEESGIKIDE